MHDLAQAEPPPAASGAKGPSGGHGDFSGATFKQQVGDNTRKLLDDGRQAFRFDTFGDETFWGDTLQLHQAIEGSAFGSGRFGITPNAAIGLGLKVNADALHDVKGTKGKPLDLDSRPRRSHCSRPARALD